MNDDKDESNNILSNRKDTILVKTFKTQLKI